MKRGLIQKELAAMVGVNKHTVANWERYASVPRASDARLEKACDVLDLTFRGMAVTFPWKDPLRRRSGSAGLASLRPLHQ